MPDRRTRSANTRSAGVAPARASTRKKNASACAMRRPGLRLHSCRKAFRRRLLKPGGIDHREGKIAEPPVAFPAVAGYPRLVVHQREPRADQPVEQRRLADIGPADNGDGEGHDATCGDGQKHDVASAPGLLSKMINAKTYWAPGD